VGISSVTSEEAPTFRRLIAKVAYECFMGKSLASEIGYACLIVKVAGRPYFEVAVERFSLVNPPLHGRLMSKKIKPRRHHHKSTAPASRYSQETRAGDATTVAWIVTVVMTLLCDLGAVAAHYWSSGYANARGVVMFRELLLFSGAVIGIVSLMLLPVMLKVRRVPPPTGVIVFAVCVAAAPLVALVFRAVG
jgi:hypothetical protein